MDYVGPTVDQVKWVARPNNLDEYQTWATRMQTHMWGRTQTYHAPVLIEVSLDETKRIRNKTSTSSTTLVAHYVGWSSQLLIKFIGGTEWHLLTRPEANRQNSTRNKIGIWSFLDEVTAGSAGLPQWRVLGFLCWKQRSKLCVARLFVPPLEWNELMPSLCWMVAGHRYTLDRKFAGRLSLLNW